MREWSERLQPVIDATSFSGVIRIDRGEDVLFQGAFGWADRRHAIANTVDTRFALASGAKGFTALAVVRLIEQGALELESPVRPILGDDLPMIADDVTVEHLLAHRSGIGDYLDEERHADVTDYVMPVPVHRLASTEDYVPVLEGHPAVSPAGERFVYNNGGFVVLALVAERVSGVAFADLVQREVCDRAGMTETAFLRSDRLPEHTAVGYLETDGLWTNVLHLPVLGSGDGGIYSTVADVRAFWTAFFGGRIVDERWVREMVGPRSQTSSGRYGLGLWLDAEGDGVALEGYDAGVSFRSRHDPTRDMTITVISNTSEGAWPIAKVLEQE